MCDEFNLKTRQVFWPPKDTVLIPGNRRWLAKFKNISGKGASDQETVCVSYIVKKSFKFKEFSQLKSISLDLNRKYNQK